MPAPPMVPAELSADAPARAPRVAKGRVAVVDIGSNSVRLVIYESLSRTTATVHNEKTICSIGRDLETTGLLHKEGCELALESLRRFKLLTEGIGVSLREAVGDGRGARRDQRPRIRAPGGSSLGRTGARVDGQGRGTFGSARRDRRYSRCRRAGRRSRRRQPRHVYRQRRANGRSLVAALRTAETARPDQRRHRPGAAADRQRIGENSAFQDARPSLALFGRRHLAQFARVDMLREQYPLHMLQHYTIPYARALELCTVLAKQGRKSLELMSGVSKRRMELLPYGAAVLQRLMLAAKFKDVVLSANGVREGLIYEKLSSEERSKDPLIDFATIENARLSRSPDHALEMFHWSSPLFSDENAEYRRLRMAACCSATSVGVAIPTSALTEPITKC